MIAGAQPRAWIHDRQTGEQWEVVQDGGVNEPTFAGHPRYFTTGTMDSAGNVLRVWDAAERRGVKQLPDERTTRRVVWQEEHTLMTAGYEGVFVTDLRGDRRAVLGPLTAGHVRDRQLSIGFDRKGRLLTMGERSHLYVWERPGQGKSRGGHFGPAASPCTRGRRSHCTCRTDFERVRRAARRRRPRHAAVDRDRRHHRGQRLDHGTADLLTRLFLLSSLSWIFCSTVPLTTNLTSSPTTRTRFTCKTSAMKRS